MRPRIAVVGSANVDFVMRVPCMPRPGETVGGGRFSQIFGGKGANQAVAAARAGGEVSLLARLGDDALAGAYRRHLADEGVALADVEPAPVATGAAIILVDAAGENSIAVAPGANGELTPDHVKAFALAGSAALLLQLEVPARTTMAAVEAATAAGVPVVLNYAPASGLPIALSEGIDTLVVNETETAALLGEPRVTPQDAGDAAAALRRRGPRTVVVTLGAAGVTAAHAGGVLRADAVPVEVVDTTAAGDTFCGYLAVAQAEGMPLGDALALAARAASACCGVAGAQPSIPRRAMLSR